MYRWARSDFALAESGVGCGGVTPGELAAPTEFPRRSGHASGGSRPTRSRAPCLGTLRGTAAEAPPRHLREAAGGRAAGHRSRSAAGPVFVVRSDGTSRRSPASIARPRPVFEWVEPPRHPAPVRTRGNVEEVSPATTSLTAPPQPGRLGTPAGPARQRPGRGVALAPRRCRGFEPAREAPATHRGPACQPICRETPRRCRRPRTAARRPLGVTATRCGSRT